MRAAGELMRQRIVISIMELTSANGRPPTNRELGEYLGGKSTGHIDYHLRILRDQGAITHDPKKSRGIMLADSTAEGLNQPVNKVVRIPLRGRIAAGVPIEAIEDQDEYVDMNISLPRGEDVFALRVKGKSMIEDLIDDNDVVVIRAQSTANNGDTVVALLTNGTSEVGEATLKRFYREKSGVVRLQPANATMQPLFVNEADLRIQGKVISVIREI